MSIETFVKIASVVSDGNSNSITFSNIPQGYTDLQIDFTSRGTGTSTPTILMSINGSTSLQSSKFLESYTGAATGYQGYSYTNGAVAVTVSTSHSSNAFGSSYVYLSDYTGTSFKPYFAEYHTESTTDSDYLWKGFGHGIWQNTSPITSLSFSITSGNLASGSTFTLYGIRNAKKTTGNSIKASGGTISYDGTYVVHTFNTSGTFIPTEPLVVDYLVVAGGGAGGSSVGYNECAGGGGAGGYRTTLGTSGGNSSSESKISLLPSNVYAITIGAGGAGSSTYGALNNGSNSSIYNIVSVGGGSGQSDGGANSGGSGGGAGTSGGTLRNGGAGTASQGFAGGNSGGIGGTFSGGGGGGAGGVGIAGVNNIAGNGGPGLSSSISGANVFRAGGGGGSTFSSSATQGFGGSGGGGNGTATQTNANGGDAQVNTGSGGGAGGFSGRRSGNGGSGVVIIRYKA